MDRRMRPCIRAALLAAIALATILLGTCSETNIVALLTSEVKRAHNMFLVIQSVAPTELIDVNPGVRWIVTFDREIDTTTVSAATVKIEPEAGITPKFTFSPDAKILYVEAEPFLADTTAYMITVTAGVKAADGSDMELERSWSFTTGIYPAGTVTINGGAALTNSETVSLTLYCNDASEFYSVATDEAGLTSWTSISTWPTTVVTPFTITSGDGEHAAYVKLKQGGGTTAKYSVVKSDTIILDKTPPATPTVTQYISPVGTYTNTVYVNSAYYAAGGAKNATASSTDTGGSGVASYKWTSATGVTFTTDTLATPIIQTPAADNTYSATVTATDVAGNTSNSRLVAIIRDTALPLAPVFDSTQTPLYTVNGDPRVTTWYWRSGGSVDASGVYRINLYQYQTKDAKWARVYAATASITDTIEFASKYLDGLRLKAFSDGDYILLLQEYDDAGNLSVLALGSSTIKDLDGWRIILGRAAPTTIDMPVPYRPGRPSHSFEWRSMVGAKFYTVFFKDEKSIDFTKSERVTAPACFLDIDLLRGLAYEWYVVGSTGETSPDPKLDPEKYWAFQVQ